MTNNQNNHFDALIIGGGIIGMLTARNLQSEGLSVAIIDKGNLGEEASWAAGGILSPLTPWQHNIATQPLIDEGRHGFAALANDLTQETGIDPEWVQSGILVLNIEEERKALRWAKENNEVLHILTKPSLGKKEKFVSPSFGAALHLPSASQIRPPKLISALRKSLIIRKIKVFQNLGIETFLTEGSQVTGVATKNEFFYSKKIIVCSGAWTKYLLKGDTRLDIDIEPVRGQMLLYKLPQQIISHIILKDKSYLIPRQDGHILCGSTVEHVGFNKDTTQEARLALEDTAHDLVPLLAEHKPIKQWSALRPGTQRDKPYICMHPKVTGLYLNSGHYRYGILMSIASARIMTGLISNTLSASHIGVYD